MLWIVIYIEYTLNVNSKSVRLVRKEALYLCLLYIYVISSMYKEVIIKLVECYVRASVSVDSYVSAFYKKKIYITLSHFLFPLNRWWWWCCISHKIHYCLPCKCNKIRFDVNNKTMVRVVAHTILHLFSLQLFGMFEMIEQQEQDCVSV